MPNRTINSTNKKYVIECKDGKYRIANISGTIPKNTDCYITDWHIKNGKIIKRGRIQIVPGNGDFIFSNNIIEFGNLLEYMNIAISTKFILVGNIFKKPSNHICDQVVAIDCNKVVITHNITEII